MSEAEFWRTTPAKITAIVKAKREVDKREDYRAGVLAMIVRAACGEKNVHPFDFFPQHKERAVSEPRGITNAATVRANFRAYIEATGKHGKENS